MIGNFEILTPSLGLNKSQANFSDLSGVTDLFLFNPSTYLSLVEAATSTKWIEYIANKSIIALHRIVEVEDNSEDAQIQESKQNFRYLIRDGKYRMNFLVNADVDYYILLKKLEGQNKKAIFGDINGNLLGINDGTNFKPFTLASIFVRKIGWGVFGKTSYIGVTIDLADSKEFLQGYSFKPTFDINSLSVEELTISDITSISSVIVEFNVVDACGDAVTDLVKSSFTLIDDVNGTLTNKTLTNLGSGNYRLETNEAQYLGTINILTAKYNGIEAYSFSVPDFNPLEFSSDFKIT